MATRRKRAHKCDFCGSKNHEGLEYIYPVPWPENPGMVKDNTVGLYACPDCAPKQRQMQIDLGMVDPNGSNLYRRRSVS